MRELMVIGGALLLAACGSGDVESETVESDTDATAPAGSDAETVPEGDAEVRLDENGAMVRDPAPSNSEYSDLGDCTTVRLYEEGGGFEESCEGPSGWKLTYTQSDLRENLVLIDAEGTEHELALSEQIAKGAFNDLGRTVEWRSAEGSSDPRAMIVRMNVAQPDPMSADRSVLGVVRLDGPVCLIGTVPPGPGQNVAARKLADREQLSDCLDGSERPASPDA
ncbi:hypothetical protein WJS89_09270 [Sphingomicrobium sp. XHP0235]|uniref:hypothetical protein n=1 Tax=Sphingomicrobium aquimarinum TaxID=3133971 RepID=UPI0031FF3489